MFFGSINEKDNHDPVLLAFLFGASTALTGIVIPILAKMVLDAGGNLPTGIRLLTNIPVWAYLITGSCLTYYTLTRNYLSLCHDFPRFAELAVFSSCCESWLEVTANK